VILLVVAVAVAIAALCHDALLGGGREVHGGLVGMEESSSLRVTEVPRGWRRRRAGVGSDMGWRRRRGGLGRAGHTTPSGETSFGGDLIFSF
jgi:hypothetical protein